MDGYDAEAKAGSVGKVRRLARELARHGVPEPVAAEIMAGAKGLRGAMDEKTTRWFHGAMARLDALVEADTVNAVREACACSTGGERRRIATRIRKSYATVAERLAALDREKSIVGHAIRREGDQVVVYFAASAENAACSCLKVTDRAMPLSYCRCCGGYMRAHVENALGVKTELRIRSTLLSTAGKAPCVMEFTILEET